MTASTTSRSRFFTVTGDRLDQTPSTVGRRIDAIRGGNADYVQPSTDADGNDDASPKAPEGDVGLEDEEILERARAAEKGDRFDLDVADVYHALAYNHDHPREMRSVEDEREEAFEAFQESIDRPEGVNLDTV